MARIGDLLRAVLPPSGTRQVTIAGITDQPEKSWMQQMARRATLEGEGCLSRHKVRYLLHDRDAKVCASFRETLATGGVKCLRQWAWWITVSLICRSVTPRTNLKWGGFRLALRIVRQCWTVFFRVSAGLHATWLVNSATHLWGSRRFETADDSRNNWWVAMLTFGEGWHNNHHAHPTSAHHGLAWHEIDITWLTIRFVQAIGVVRSVHVAAPAPIAFGGGAPSFQTHDAPITPGNEED